MVTDYEALKNEITNNPKTIPDLGWNQTDKWIMDTLNTPGISNETTVRELVNTADIITALFSDVVEFKSISSDEKISLNLLSPVGTIAPSVLQDVFLDMFPASGQPGERPIIRAALIALAIRPANRSEVLFGEAVDLIPINKARILHNG